MLRFLQLSKARTFWPPYRREKKHNKAIIPSGEKAQKTPQKGVMQPLPQTTPFPLRGDRNTNPMQPAFKTGFLVTWSIGVPRSELLRPTGFLANFFQKSFSGAKIVPGRFQRPRARGQNSCTPKSKKFYTHGLRVSRALRAPSAPFGRKSPRPACPPGSPPCCGPGHRRRHRTPCFTWQVYPRRTGNARDRILHRNKWRNVQKGNQTCTRTIPYSGPF